MFLSSNLNLTPAKDYEAPEECKELLKLPAMPPPKRRKRGEAAEEGHEEEGDEEDDDGSEGESEEDETSKPVASASGKRRGRAKAKAAAKRKPAKKEQPKKEKKPKKEERQKKEEKQKKEKPQKEEKPKKERKPKMAPEVAKALASKRDCAYHKARKEALKQGLTDEEAKQKGKEATCSSHFPRGHVDFFWTEARKAVVL